MQRSATAVLLPFSTSVCITAWLYYWPQSSASCSTLKASVSWCLARKKIVSSSVSWPDIPLSTVPTWISITRKQSKSHKTQQNKKTNDISSSNLVGRLIYSRLQTMGVCQGEESKYSLAPSGVILNFTSSYLNTLKITAKSGFTFPRFTA